MSSESDILRKLKSLAPEKRTALLELLSRWSKPDSRQKSNAKLKNPLGAAKGMGGHLPLHEFQTARRKAWRIKGG